MSGASDVEEAKLDYAELVEAGYGTVDARGRFVPKDRDLWHAMAYGYEKFRVVRAGGRRLLVLDKSRRT